MKMLLKPADGASEGHEVLQKIADYARQTRVAQPIQAPTFCRSSELQADLWVLIRRRHCPRFAD